MSSVPAFFRTLEQYPVMSNFLGLVSRNEQSSEGILVALVKQVLNSFLDDFIGLVFLANANKNIINELTQVLLQQQMVVEAREEDFQPTAGTSLGSKMACSIHAIHTIHAVHGS